MLFSGFLARSDTICKQDFTTTEVARGLKFWNYEVEELDYQCSENKGADQLQGTTQLICTFVFVYAK